MSLSPTENKSDTRSPYLPLDRNGLRQDRLKKVQREMRARGIGASLMTNPVAIRYATGTSCMSIWTSLNLARYALVPAEGEPIVYEYGKALYLTQPIWPKSRPALYWQYRFSQHTAVEAARKWAEDIRGQLSEWGVAKEKLAIDTLDFYGFEALKAAGLTLTDLDEPMEAAKLIKTPEEIRCLEHACAVGDAALYALESAIKPGVSENALYAVFNEKLLSLGADFCSTRLLCSGERTNPWFQEAGERIVRPGDLIGIDTDMTGPEGYLCDISRTFLCGDRANADQKEAYRVAYDFLGALQEMCRVGVSFRDLKEKAPKYPREYERQGYSCMIHGSGFDDEPPFIGYPHDVGGVTPEGVLEENMVISLEFYAGKEGKRDGVKLEDQIQITKNGPRLLSHYPFEARLL